jgi:hypothetical protein
MKKLFSIALVLVLLLNVTTLFGCSKEETVKTEKTVMHLSLNPEIEVVLDEEDKVITVNALNEEGNLIISAEAFRNVEGKSAEEVARLFVQVSKDTGYLVTGHVGEGENQISISISGDQKLAEELYQDVKSQVDGYLEEVDLEATLTQAATLTEAQLRVALAECAPYIEEAKLQAMEHKELVEQLAACRKETAEMYSQELKNAYYDAKAFAMEQAKMEALKQQLPMAEKLIFDALNKGYVASVKLVEKTRMELLIDENSIYQLALADLRARKAEYLSYRNELALKDPESLTEEMKQHLADLEAALDAAEDVLMTHSEYAHRMLDEVKAQMTTAYNQLLSLFEDIDMTALADEISQKQTAALDVFFTEFETRYAGAKEAAKQNWNKMALGLSRKEQ